MTMNLIPSWEFYILETILCITLASWLAYLIAYEVLTARLITKALSTALGLMWARRITALSYEPYDAYRVVGIQARPNVRGMR